MATGAAGRNVPGGSRLEFPSMRAPTTSTLSRLVFFLWPVPFILGAADRFAGTWPADAAYAVAVALVIAALAAAWSGYRSRQ